MLEHALSYAARGWRVMPLHHIGTDGYCTCRPTERRPKAHVECPSPGKHPRIKTGRAFELATTDEAQIRAWWKKWPLANIGIATGQASKLCVVDADSEAGMRLLASIAEPHGGLPPTLMSRTGRDGVGFHWWFACEAPSPSNSGQGLDIRGDGGNLVAPPSMHISGRPYAFLNELPPAPMPAWLLDWFQNRDREARPSSPAAGKEVHGLPEHLRGRVGAGLSRRPAVLELPPIADVESALEAIPNDNRSWDEWNRIGMAVYRATEGSEAGLDAFDYWSQKSRKYEPEAPEERWRAYGGSPPDSIGYGSLWYEAKQADPAWQPPSHARVEAIPLEQRAFSPSPVNQTFNGRSADTNGFHVNGHSSVASLFVPKTPADPLIELNEKFAVIGDIGGKCRVLGWVPSKVDPRVKIPSFQDFKAFSERYAARYIEVPVTKKNGEVEIEPKQIGAYWLKWHGRKSFEGIDLSPNAPPVLEGNILNLWSGFAIQPAPGRWDRMRDHITDILADGKSDAAAYILRYAAWCLQHPGDRAEVALVFRGEKGSGKGTFARALKDIFGQHGLHIFSAKHLTGNFNAHLRTCLLLFSDEAFWAGDKQGESTLKGLLTEPTMMIEQKGVDASPWRNRLKVIMAANNEWVVPAGPMERRYAVFNVGESRVQDYAYFKRLNAELDTGGLAAMAHDLINLDLEGWHPRDVLKTEALLEQKRQSMSPLQEWFCSILDDGVIPGAGESDMVHVSALHRQAQESWRRMQDVSPVAMGRFLKKHGCYAVHTAKGTAWRFPRLAELRAKWVKAYGGQWAWDEELSDWRRR
jgi:hypothetical protein